MKNPNESMAMLDMFTHPVFRVADGTITHVNTYAAACGVKEDTPIAPMLSSNQEEYAAFESCLSLGLEIEGAPYIATVFRTENGDIVHLQASKETPETRILALAAQQLRAPLSEVMAAADGLSDKETAGLINKGLYQLLRQISNMSAASTYRQGRLYGMETANATAVINETMDKALLLCNKEGTRLAYKSLTEDIYCPVDREMLERAIYNLVSNAIKFSPAGSIASAVLTASAGKLRFSIESLVEDTALTQSNLFMRYVREPNVEDGRHGLGLGIPLTQYAAAAHGGTILMDRPTENTIRFTITVSMENPKGPVVSTPFPDFDYMGGWDHSLVELSDILPASAFENI